jgi:ClpP class serine protease
LVSVLSFPRNCYNLRSMNTAKNKLIQAAAAPMMLDASAENAFRELIAELAAGTQPQARYDDEVMRTIKPYGAAYQEAEQHYVTYPVQIGTTLIIPIEGFLFQDDNGPYPGTSTIAGWYNAAASDASVENIIEIMNSPGGGVFGLSEVAEAKVNCSKPIETIVRGMCASAAYWIAAASDKIYASGNGCVIGSIGTKTRFMSMKKYGEKMGVIDETIYSADSPNKDADVRAAEAGDFAPMQNGMLKDFDNIFMAFVSSRRSVSTEALKGNAYITEKALAEGLIDGVKSLNNYLSQIQTNSEMENKNVTFLSKLANLFTGDATEEEVSAAAQEANAQLTQLTETVVVHQAAQAAAEQLAADAQASIVTMQAAHATEKAGLEAKIRNQDAPAGPPTDPKSEDEPLATKKPQILDPLTAQIKADLEAYED